NHVTAEESRATEDRDQGVGIGLRGHLLPFARARAGLGRVRAADIVALRHTGSARRCTGLPKCARECRRAPPDAAIARRRVDKGKPAPLCLRALPRWRNW